MSKGRKAKPQPLPAEQQGPPDKPKTISVDPVASSLWDALVDLLMAQRVLSPADGSILTSLCSAFSRLCVARETLRKEGYFVQTAKTLAIKAHPAVAMESAAAGELHRYSAELGLSPTARAKIQLLEEAKPVDEMDAFLANADSDI